MGVSNQFLLVDIRGRVYVSSHAQEYVGIVAVSRVIDLATGKECDGGGNQHPIEVAPPSQPPLNWDE